MKRFSLLLIVLFLGHSSIAESPLDSLVNAERAFSKMSQEKGRKAAFVEYFAGHSVIFKEQWIAGRKYHMEQPESSGTLTWDPRIADISQDGTLGYTTGPWVFRKDQNIAHGYYMSIWQKQQKEGTWTVVLDQGISTTGVSSMPKDRPIWAPGGALAGKLSSDQSPKTILDQEDSFEKIVLQKGLVAAYKEKGAADFLLFREGHEPASGEIAFKLISSSPVPHTMSAQKADAAAGLGYAYGKWSGKTTEGQTQNGGFVRLWKQHAEGTWRIVLDLTL